MKKILVSVFILALCIGGMKFMVSDTGRRAYNTAKNFIRRTDMYSLSCPQEIAAMAQKNPETEEFVKNWPEKHGTYEDIDRLGIDDFSSPPLLMQWDMRWGYRQYSGQAAALSGCGPLCLSMAAIYALEDDSLTPVKMMEFAEQNGYDTDGSGSMHSLIYEGGPALGLDVESIDVSRAEFFTRLENGSCIIRLMGPGDFTSKGHFILLAETDGEYITVNDPNSRKNSEKLWTFARLESQIREAWQVKKHI